MRTLKFRAWHADNCQMVYDWAVYTDRWTLKANVAGATIPMQFTGLKDKNGREGYTDDLVRLYPRESIYRVVWNDLLACFQLKLVSGDDYDERYGQVLAMHLLIFSEIIGNIHENPDLLSK